MSRFPAEFRDLIRLAVPVVVVQVGMMTMGVADTVMVGHVSATDLAAVALGNLYFFSVAIFGLGILLALDPIVSQAVGANDTEGVSRAVQRGLLLAAVLGTVAGVLLAPGEVVLPWLRQPPDVIPVAAGYAVASIAGVYPFLGFAVFRQTLQAMGRLRAIVRTVLIANLLNVFFNWVLVYGNLGMPALGAVGTGWATSLSRWCLFLGLGVGAWKILAPHLYPIRPEILRWQPMKRVLVLGAPIGVQFSLEYGAFAFTGLMMGLLGTVAMAGHQVALNLASLTFMVPLGVAQATSVLVGRAVGRGDPVGARRSAAAGLWTGGSFMLASAVLFLAAPGLLAAAYTSDAAVLALAATLIPLAGVFQVFDGLQAVASGVLRGVGDTRAPMVLHALGFWMLGLPLGLVLAFAVGAGPLGLWWGLVAGLGAVAALLLLRVRVRMARALDRLVIDEVHPEELALAHPDVALPGPGSGV